MAWIVCTHAFKTGNRNFPNIFFISAYKKTLTDCRETNTSGQHELSGDRKDTLIARHYSLWKHTKVLPILRNEYIL